MCGSGGQRVARENGMLGCSLNELPPPEVRPVSRPKMVDKPSFPKTTYPLPYKPSLKELLITIRLVVN